MEAIRRFDPDKGARLTTSAALWIRFDGAGLADVLPDAAPPPDRRLEIAELASRVRRSARALAPRP